MDSEHSWIQAGLESLDNAFLIGYIPKMEWGIEFTDEFGAWWDTLDEEEQKSVGAIVTVLEKVGPGLKFPYSSGVESSRYPHMRELRIQHQGEPYRVFYAFDPRRVAILLLGGSKTGNNRWYEIHVPQADRIYEQYLEELREDELIHED